MKKFEELEKAISKVLPNQISLYNIAYDENLNSCPDIVQDAIIANDMYEVLDSEVDNEMCAEADSIVEEVKEKLNSETFSEDISEDDLEDCIREMVQARDTSTPSKDILANTNLNAYYDLGVEAGDWHAEAFVEPYRDKTQDEDIKDFCSILHIPEDDERKELVKSLVENLMGGGNLRIYFRTDLTKLFSDPNKGEDYKSISFNGNCIVAVVDSVQGSAYYEEINLDVTYPFKRDNLRISKAEKYNIEMIMGLYDSFTFGGTEPEFSYEKCDGSELKTISAENHKTEKEYIKTYKEGGCTLGDTDMTRHRDVKYSNEYPCGWRCPHCGQFWID